MWGLSTNNTQGGLNLVSGESGMRKLCQGSGAGDIQICAPILWRRDPMVASFEKCMESVQMRRKESSKGGRTAAMLSNASTGSTIGAARV